MPYPISSQLNKDIDFFILDKNQQKYHFASAGGLLPNIVVDNYKENNRIQVSVLKLEVLYEVEINPNLERYIQFENDIFKNIYLKDFIFYAERGFVSYDRTNISDFKNKDYHLVVKPSNRIKNGKSENLYNNLKANILINKVETFNINKL